MKWLLFAAFFLGLSAAHAQTTPPGASEQLVMYRYCVLVVDGLYFSRPKSLFLDYWQGLPSAAATDVEMEQLVANLKKTSIVGTLNALGQHHWELVNTLEVRGSSLDRETFLELETRYFFRRRLP